MSQSIKPAYTVTADNPETAAKIIRAMLDEKGATVEAERLKAAGMKNVKIAETKNPTGDAG